MSQIVSKEDAYKLIDELPENATWEDLMQQIYVRIAVESGLAESDAGRTTDVNDVRRKHGLTQ